MEKIVIAFLLLLVAYGAIGFVFAIAFLLRGAQRIDEGVRGTSIGFRLILLPGTILLWPVLFGKWMKAIKEKNQKQLT